MGGRPQRYRDSTQNLRTQFKRIIKKAGIEPWPKLWQNLRSTRVTELADDFPEHVVVQWLGHSEKVAREHYLQVTDEHINRAVMGETSSSKSASKSASAPSGLGMNRTAQSFRKESVTVDSATRNTHMHQQAGVSKWAIQDSNYVQKPQVIRHFVKRAVQNPVQRVHAGGCFERNRVQGKNSKSTLITSIPKKTAQCINTGLSLMGHTGLEQ